MSALAKAGIVAATVVVVAVCAALGWWQWTRASQHAISVAPEPTVPLADVLSPATKASQAVGRQVSVSGEWADQDAVVVRGRHVEGEPADVLVRALVVDAAHTGTGQPATLTVMVGWRPAGSFDGPAPAPGSVELTGYLRAPEEATAGSPTPGTVPGVVYTDTVSPSEFAQDWPSPLYSAVLSTYEGDEMWRPLPPPPPETTINFRSAAYALEWWLFGGFAVFIAWRALRDNRSTVEQEESAQ